MLTYFFYNCTTYLIICFTLVQLIHGKCPADRAKDPANSMQGHSWVWLLS